MYESGTDPAAVDFLQVRLYDLVAFGDLDYDGRQDAAILLAENTGGTGIFVSLIAILDSEGTPFQAAAVYIDDRPVPASLAIQSGEILLEATVHGSEDPMCCPSEQKGLGFRLYEDQLVLTHMESLTPDGSLRAINIASPVDLAEVTYPVTVSGNVTIGPFENTLAYNVFDPANALVTAGSLMTDSPDMGLPGNFSLVLDLTMAGVTGLVRVEIVEYSMKDGSILTLDSVLVDVP
jgi:Immunoglobulin-like domain of bacterial spore germination